MLDKLKDLLEAYKKRDPAARSYAEILLLYPGLHALGYHRLAHALYKRGLQFEARLISQFSRFITGIEIHPGAKIGRRLVIDHGMGVVIGETTEIGDDVLLYQGCTLGGSGKETGKRHPTIGNNVMIGAGSHILGSFKVGDNTRIAANAVVLEEIPPDSTAVGIPAKVVRVKGRRPDFLEQLDHCRTPDPTSAELSKLKDRIKTLEEEVAELKKVV